jgi:hypothetical protein
MPTINGSSLLHSVSSLGGARPETESQSLRRITQTQAAELARLRGENGELLALLDQANRRATIAECRLRTAEADHKGERETLERALWRGPVASDREVGRFECSGKGVG